MVPKTLKPKKPKKPVAVAGQVVPALDPSTPIYAGGFSMQLIKRRMMEFSLWNPDRFKVFRMRERFQLGPFECAPHRGDKRRLAEPGGPAMLEQGGWLLMVRAFVSSPW